MVFRVLSVLFSVFYAAISFAQIEPARGSIFELTHTQAAQRSATLVINEADVDTPGFDDREFIELHGLPGESLDGIALVLYRGNNNTVYQAYDLTGNNLNDLGLFVVGNALVQNVDYIIPDNTLRNGPDAIALYTAPAADFPMGTGVILDGILDALVYDTNDPLAVELLPLLLPDQPQINEGVNGNAALESMSRVPDGGEQRVTETYVVQTPTPGQYNIPACEGGALSFADSDEDQVVACVDIQDEAVSFLVNGEVPQGEYALLVTNQVNQIIEIVYGTEIDFFGSNSGVVRVWGLAYTGTLTASTLAPGLPITGITSDDCAVLSTGYLTVDRQVCIPPDCLGGTVSVNGSTSAQTICWNGDNPVLIFETDSEYTPFYLWVITNFQGTLLEFTTESTFDLSAYGSGTLFVRGYAYTGELAEGTLQPGLSLSNVVTDDCWSLSSNAVQINSSFCAFTGGCSDLFISEYIEGNANNKAIELYNPTPFPINLGPYVIETYNNSATTPTNSLNLSGVIESGDVYVIGNPEAVAAIISVSDVLDNVTFFNGNDPIVLKKNGEIIDMMGMIGPEFDPLEPNGFLVDNGNGSMSEHTLVRSANVTQGTPDWSIGQNQWDVYPQDTFTFLGSHSTGLCDFPDEPTISFSNAEISVVQGLTVQFGVGIDWPADENLAQVNLIGGTAEAGVHFESIFPLEVVMPQDVFTSQVFSFVTYNDVSIEEPVTVELELIPLTPAQTAIGFLTITILPFQDPPEAPLYDIIEVHDEDEATGEALSSGEFCELRGVVHGVNLNSSGLFFTLIDPTAGIAVYHPEQNFGYAVNEGDSLRVIGSIDQFNGLTRIVPIYVELVSGGNELYSPELVVSLGEETESQVIEFKCVELVNPEQWTNEGDWFEVEVSGGISSYMLRIYSETNLFGTAPPEGVFSISGIGSQYDEEAPYNSGYFVIPRYLADFSEPVNAMFEVPEGIEAGQDFTFTNSSDGAAEYNWTFGDGTSSTETNPQHSYTEPGFYTVTLTAFDNEGVCSDQMVITIEILDVSVAEHDRLNVRFFPNPATESVTIASDRQIESYRIYDLKGSLIIEEQQIDQRQIVVPVSHLAVGIYLLEVGRTRMKLVISR